jgi:putative nucleotidyltransferase with HDIG domain
MTRIENLEAKVRKLYEAKDPNRADWADWLYDQHVFIVADNAESLAERFGANKEYARAAAMLHDIADAKMSRFDESHEDESLAISRHLLQESEYTPDEIALIVDDAIKFHSCHDGNIPHSLEGKVLATADSLAHLTTNFYETAATALKDEKTPEQIQQWVLKKLDRDFYNKVLFDEIKAEVQPHYERLKAQYTSVG